MSYFRALAYGINPPVNTAEPAGAVLWFRSRPNGYVRVIEEFPFVQLDEKQLVAEVLRIDARLHAGPIEFTVASPKLFPKPADSYPGVIGEYVSTRLSGYGMPLIPADDDEINGWARVQALFESGPSGVPWMSIDPKCDVLIKHLGNALSDETHPDELASYSPLLTALRFGVMAQPAASDGSIMTSEPPFGSPAYFMKRERESGSRRFGQVRA